MCPKCGNKSLAEIVDHSCEMCQDLYQFCPRCILADERLLDKGKVQRHKGYWRIEKNV